MKISYWAVLPVLCLLIACESVLYSHPEGSLRADGRIEPCHDSRTDPQACGNARFNGPLLSKLQLGMTKDEVRSLMQHDAERFEARTDGEKKIEVWMYMQDYDRERMTSITFTDGRVTAIGSVPWDE